MNQNNKGFRLKQSCLACLNSWILLVSVVFHQNESNQNYGREFDINGAEKPSEDDVLRGAHFKVLGFQVNNKYSYN